jgi:hypothetical protein
MQQETPFHLKFPMSVPHKRAIADLPSCVFCLRQVGAKSVELGSWPAVFARQFAVPARTVRDDSVVAGVGGVVLIAQRWESIQESRVIEALFSSPQNSKFFHSLFITSIFSYLHRVLNVGKKITNYTV